MKLLIRLSLVVLALVFAGTVTAQTGKKDKKSKKPAKEETTTMAFDMNDTLTQVSYALAVNIVNNLKQQGLDSFNQAAFAEGVKHALEGDSLLMSSGEINQVLQMYFNKLQEEKTKMASKEGEAFLAENAKRPEVRITESGLQYEVLVAADGPKPAATDQVTVHYKGTLIDGKQFDSSYDRGQPATFGLNQVIPGWTEGVQLMSEGAKYRFYIPYQLGYGERGAGGDIPPYSTLIFDVELIKIN